MATTKTRKRKRMIGEVMTRDVRTLAPDSSAAEAARLMRDLGVGMVPVASEGKVVGVLTDRDIVVRCLAEGRDFSGCTVADMMSTGVAFCRPGDDVRYAAAMMEERRIRRLVVVDDDDRIVGIVSLGDLAVETGDKKLSAEVLERISRPIHQSGAGPAGPSPVGIAGGVETRPGGVAGRKRGRELLAGLVQGELSALETYRQALEKVADDPGAADLRRMENEHEEAAALLQDAIARFGVEPPESSGAWGAWALLVQGVAKLFGDKAAIKALKEGEEHGLRDYEYALSDESLDDGLKSVIREKLLPQTRAHIAILDTFLGARAGPSGSGRDAA